MPGGALLRRHQISYNQVIMITTARVSTSYKAQYSDPIAFEPGDLLTLTGRSDNWNGNTWLWAVASKDGREGWIPDSLANAALTSPQVATMSYNARELDCHEGELLTVTNATHGWCWCENERGVSGWVPEENLLMQIPD